jgi:hypothetical protein
MNYNELRAKELSEKADRYEFEYIRAKELSEYISAHSDTLTMQEVDFLLSWMNHSKFTADEILAMLYEAENG